MSANANIRAGRAYVEVTAETSRPRSSGSRGLRRIDDLEGLEPLAQETPVAGDQGVGEFQGVGTDHEVGG